MRSGRPSSSGGASGVGSGSTVPLRCAIYTRKSTEDGLEQSFNSLDAQREACGAHILSQAGEGWSASPDLYDDGGISGGTMERPALKRLLADIAAGRIQIIVVYKVDRLTRSLADFAKIVEILDAAGASFVSVTQAFNTTTSMGRLTLNVLLSFAQFEREVTGERIRDKVAASKKKGVFMGGPVPAGYDVVDRKLMINADEAKTVRHIFSRYLALGSVFDLVDDLQRTGLTTRQRTMTSGRVTGGTPYCRGGIVHMLRNPIYIGKVRHRAEVFDGEHAGIIAADLWEAVQTKLDANTADNRTRRHVRHRSLLAGIAFDGLGRRLSPSHSRSGARRLRYYITHRDAVPVDGPAQWRLPAHDLEHIVTTALIGWLDAADINLAEHLLDLPANDQHAIAARGRRLASLLRDGTPHERYDTFREMVSQVDVGDAAITIAASWQPLLDEQIAMDDTMITITAPATRVRRGDEVRLIIGAQDPVANRDERLVALMTEARAARDRLLVSDHANLDGVAASLGQSRKHLSRLVRLATLAPDIVTAIVDGRQPAQLTRLAMLSANDLPVDWARQRAMFGFSAATERSSPAQQHPIDHCLWGHGSWPARPGAEPAGIWGRRPLDRPER